MTLNAGRLLLLCCVENLDAMFFASSLRSFVPWACLSLALLLAMPDSHAGTYVGIYKDYVTGAPSQYSGGTHYTITGSPSPGNYTFGNVPDSSTGTGYGGGSSGNGVPGEGTQSNCSGAIQTAWNWVPATGQTMTTDPPPAQVIITQTCGVGAATGVIGSTWS